MATQAILFAACGILFDVYSIPHVAEKLSPGKGGYDGYKASWVNCTHISLDELVATQYGQGNSLADLLAFVANDHEHA